MNTILVKNISTMFFIVFLMIVALSIPTSALFNNPIFYNDAVQKYEFKKNNISIYRSRGFTLTNISHQNVLLAQEIPMTTSLYDLYLGFDGKDFTNNYTIVKNNYEKNTLQMFQGHASAKFVSSDNAIVLFPNQESILRNSATLSHNFTITFQLYPYRVGEGTQYIASYEGYYTDPLVGVKTIGFVISLEEGVVNYHFKNLFVDENGISYDFTLREQQPVVNTSWERHTVVVDSSQGLIKIYRNNTEQDLVFIKDNRNYNGRRLYLSPYFSKIDNIPLTIGENGVFSLDEFTVYQDIVTNFMNHTPNKMLFFETDVFQISQNISSLYEMGVDLSSTNVSYRLAYRINDEYFRPDKQTLEMPWVYIDTARKTFPLTHKQGKFLQWRVEYYMPDKPSEDLFFVKDIFADFKETVNPGTIQIESVIAKNGSIELAWRTLPNNLIVSYEIYYGDSSNNYFGKSTISPSSPISVDIQRNSISTDIQYILEGLENEKSYYISIRAKDIYGQYGPFSPEIISRPSSVNNELGFSIGR